jgi:hypothetical protein
MRRYRCEFAKAATGKCASGECGDEIRIEGACTERIEVYQR